MDKRTMVKIYGTDDTYSLRTISRNFRSPHRFIIQKKEFERLEQEGSVIVNDMSSYAALILDKSQTGQKILQINFTWLNSTDGVVMKGQKEVVRLPYTVFRDPVFDELCRGQEKKVLSIQSGLEKARIEFKSRSHLREVASHPILRSKLAHFMAGHFNWKNSQCIILTDDFEPYSFEFTEYTKHGVGLCGAVILHGRENLKTAYYGIHT